MQSNNDSLKRRDLQHIWHPCTQMKDHQWLPMIPIRRGEGVWLEDYDGKRYIDAVSSWWVNLFGHANPYIGQAIKQQLDTLEHVIFAGFTHEPIIELSERLLKILPPGLNRCFYADNGSAAVEVALKMSFHYWHNLGNSRKTRFITLGNSYHGETLGALAVGDVTLYKDTYQPLLMTPITAPSPDCYLRESGESWESYSLRQCAAMETLLQQNHEEVCAVIVEPLVQCAGQMRMYHPAYLTRLRELCNQYDIHLIADEIAVGFGRTGKMFACEHAGITPDFICLSKGLTGGFMPLSVVVTTEQIYEAFYDDYGTLKAFLHSHSYTGNPLACRAALATLDLFEQSPVLERNTQLAAHMAKATAHFADHPHVAEVRQTGMILAIEMVQEKATKAPWPWQERRGLRVYQHALQQQALLRPLGPVVYFMPPYVISEDEIDHLAKVAWDGICLATQR